MDDATPDRSTQSVRGRLDRIDLLRGVAVLLVMLRHLQVPRPIDPAWLGTAIDLARRPAWSGVDLFFVLSGFLVSGLLFQEYRRFGSVQVGRFLIRRAFKIYPGFYFMLAAVYLLAHWTGGAPERIQLLRQALFIQNYFPIPSQIWIHTWSLAVEEHFYLLLAIAASWAFRPGRMPPTWRAQVTGFAVVALTVLAARVVATMAALGQGWDPVKVYSPTHLRIDSLLFGVLLSALRHFNPDGWQRLVARRRTVLAASALLLSSTLWFELADPATSTLGYTFCYLGYGGVLVWLISAPESGRPRPGWWRGLVVIGTYSYPIYLWHLPVREFALPAVARMVGPLSLAGSAAVYLVGSIVVGMGLGKLIELPFLRLRDAWFPSRSGGLATPRPT